MHACMCVGLLLRGSCNRMHEIEKLTNTAATATAFHDEALIPIASWGRFLVLPGLRGKCIWYLLGVDQMEFQEETKYLHIKAKGSRMQLLRCQSRLKGIYLVMAGVARTTKIKAGLFAILD